MIIPFYLTMPVDIRLAAQIFVRSSTDQTVGTDPHGEIVRIVLGIGTSALKNIAEGSLVVLAYFMMPNLLLNSMLIRL